MSKNKYYLVIWIIIFMALITYLNTQLLLQGLSAIYGYLILTFPLFVAIYLFLHILFTEASNG